MRYFVWLLRAFLFVLFLGFTVKNDQPVVLRYFFGFEWQVSLVVALLLFFAAGVGIGLLALMGSILRQRKEIARLARELQLKNKLVDANDA
jgi:lipopolysaccharide assembly protein A